MADASKLRSRRKPSAPPPPDDVNPQFTDPAPESAATPEPGPAAPKAESVREETQSAAALPPSAHSQRVDGRTLRRSGRTLQFATRVSADWDGRLREAAQARGMLLVEVLEQSLAAWERICSVADAHNRTPESVLESALKAWDSRHAKGKTND